LSPCPPISALPAARFLLLVPSCLSGQFFRLSEGLAGPPQNLTRPQDLTRSDRIGRERPRFCAIFCHVLAQMAEFGLILHQRGASKRVSFSNTRLRPGGSTVSKSFRWSTRSPVLLRESANKQSGINRLPSPRFTRATKPEKVSRPLSREHGYKSFRMSKPAPVLLRKLANNHC